VRKILVVGEFVEGGASNSYLKVFSDLRYDAQAFNIKKKYFPSVFFSLPKLSYLFFKINDFLINLRLKRLVKRVSPDLIFIAKCENLSYKTIRFLKNKLNCKIINFYPDNPFCFWSGNSNANVLLSLPYYDCFLIWSKMLIPAIESAGCKKVFYFPFVFDENIFDKDFLLDENDLKQYKSDVCFVGTWEKDRQVWLEKLIKKMPNLDLAVWGNLWLEKLDKNSPLLPKIKDNAIYGDLMIKAFRSSKIVLNFIRRQNITSHNMRTVEVPASKGFLLTERTFEQAEELFCENESISCFSDLEELVFKIEFYFKNENERLRIARNSWKHVKKYKLKDNLKVFLEKFEKGI